MGAVLRSAGRMVDLVIFHLEKLSTILPTLVTILVFLMIFSIGLNTRRKYFTYFSGKAGLLFRSLLASILIPPAIGMLLVLLFRPGILVSAALLLLCAAPGAPMAAFKVYKAEGVYSYGISLQIILITVSAITLPLCLGLFNSYFDLGLQTDMYVLSKRILLMIILPIGIGYLTGQFFSGWVEKYGRKFAKFVNGLLVLAVLPLLWFMRGAFLEWRLQDYIMFLIFVFLLFVSGHILGGPVKKHRITLAVESASRNLGLCIFIAIQSFDKTEFIRVLLPYVLINIVLGIVYDKLTPPSINENT